MDANGKRQGLKAFRDSYSLFGYYPKILIAPVYGSLAGVSAELIATATAIRAITLIDTPSALSPQQVITGRGPAGTININTSSDRVGICYPYVKALDTASNAEALFPMSPYAAGALSRRDQEQGSPTFS